MNIARCSTGAKGIFLVRKINVLCYFKGVPFDKNAAKSYPSRFKIQGSLFFEGCLFLKGVPFFGCLFVGCLVVGCLVVECLNVGCLNIGCLFAKVPFCRVAFL